MTTCSDAGSGNGAHPHAGYSHAVLQPSLCTPEFLAAFRDFLATVPQYHFFQDPWWFICNARAEVELVVTRRGGQIVAGSLLDRSSYRFLSKAKYIVRNGPLYADESALRHHLVYLLEKLSATAFELRISPPWPTSQNDRMTTVLGELGFNAYRNSQGNYSSTVVLPLAADLQQIRAGFSSNLRRQLNRAERQGVVIDRVQDRVMLDSLLLQIGEFSLRRGLGLPDPAVLECYLQRRLLEEENGVALVERRDGKMMAGIVVIGCGGRAIFSYGFRREEQGDGQSGNTHLLHFRAIGWAREQGYHLYDFGGYDESLGNEDGINRFKLGFSDRVERVSCDYLYSFQPAVSRIFAMIDRLRSRGVNRP